MNTLKKPHRVKKNKRLARVERNQFLKHLLKNHFLVPFILYTPVTFYFVYSAFLIHDNSAMVFLAAAACGLLFWTFSEYLLHRYVFHFTSGMDSVRRIYFMLHGMHHAYPSDKSKVTIPASASTPLIVGFYFMFYGVIPDRYVSAFFAGFVIGYLFYELLHYALHRMCFHSEYWQKLQQRHLDHHFKNSHRGYGVSSQLWDKIFRSDFEN